MEQLNILAIDGGNEMSGYCVLADDYTPLEFGKVANDTLLQMLPDLWERYEPLLAIEQFESYGNIHRQFCSRSCYAQFRKKEEADE